MGITPQQQRLGFIHVPKVAGTSMEKALGFIGTTHSTVKAAKANQPSKFHWAFVRHPADRFVSAWAHTVKRAVVRKPCSKYAFEGFDSFARSVRDPKIRDGLVVTQTMENYLCVDGVVGVDFIGRFENIEADWKEALRLIEVPYVRLFVSNATEHKPWREMYTDETLKCIEEAYSRDYELFGYEKECL